MPYRIDSATLCIMFKLILIFDYGNQDNIIKLKPILKY